MSWPRDGSSARDAHSAGWGIAAGAGFAMAASRIPGCSHPPRRRLLRVSRTVTSAATLCIQTVLSILWLVLMNRSALRRVLMAWRESVAAGLAGAVASNSGFWRSPCRLQRPCAPSD